MGERKQRQPWARLTEGERGRFLQVLRETGNRRTAANAIGAEPRLMDQRRDHDPEFDQAWEEATLEAHRRLSAADAPFGGGAGEGGEGVGGRTSAIRRGKKGRLQLVETGARRWSGEVEARFLAALRASGNVRAAARSVGFCESTVWARRRQSPALASAMEEMLEDAELALEYRIACMASEEASGGARGEREENGALASPPADAGLEPLPFDPDFAMRFLKWREDKRRGGKRRTPKAAPPSIEEATEIILRRIAPIKRHGEREAGADADPGAGGEA